MSCCLSSSRSETLLLVWSSSLRSLCTNLYLVALRVVFCPCTLPLWLEGSMGFSQIQGRTPPPVEKPQRRAPSLATYRSGIGLILGTVRPGSAFLNFAETSSRAKKPPLGCIIDGQDQDQHYSQRMTNTAGKLPDESSGIEKTRLTTRESKV